MKAVIESRCESFKFGWRGHLVHMYIIICSFLRITIVIFSIHNLTGQSDGTMVLCQRVKSAVITLD